MRSAELLTYAYDQVHDTLRSALGGAPPEELTRRPAAEANTVAWLAWHLLRVQDDHVAEIAGREQVWTADGWAGRFDLPFDTSATGYGFDPDEVAAVRVPSADLLLGYADAVHRASAAYLGGLSDDDLDRVVDDSYDPPVTVGVRLVSVLVDDLQHLGQLSYARGMLAGQG
jgi:uncharacterized damage-inducible protein DinB